MKPLRVSVAMIAYNQASLVSKAIDSVLKQKRDFELEIVIGDDASNDETPDVLKAYEKKHPEIRVHLRNKNLGSNENFKEVFQSCTGKYIAELEGDDFWIDDEKLMKQVDFLEKNPSCTVVGAYARIERDGVFQETLPRPEQISFFKERLGTVEDALKLYFIHTSTVMVRNVLGSRLPADYARIKFGDRLFVLLHADKGSIGFVHDEVSVYRQVPTGICYGISEIERAKFDLQFFEEIGRYLNKKHEDIISEQKTNHRVRVIHLLEASDQWQEARSQLFRLVQDGIGHLRVGEFTKLTFRTLFPKLFGLVKVWKRVRAPR